MVEIITIEKAELIRLIDTSVAGAIEKAIHSSQPPQIMTKSEVAKYLKKSGATINRWMRKMAFRFTEWAGQLSTELRWMPG